MVVRVEYRDPDTFFWKDCEELVRDISLKDAIEYAQYMAETACYSIRVREDEITRYLFEF